MTLAQVATSADLAHLTACPFVLPDTPEPDHPESDHTGDLFAGVDREGSSA
jgi:hypothetical protein